ncbi:MAG: UDP-3-O-(3-hydroxymyristoyl)glucosamine N-acyltransferase [Flavobacteriales bacterium]|nr:MAG: UDP-3-O-(3-hydroxymyristoyl)glucosamine N-acyltransferase [Flavobacteriales bacterium]
MEFTAEQIAGLLNGEIEGNPETIVNKLSKIEEGESKSLSFLANLTYEEYLYTTDASIVIVNKDLNLSSSIKDTCTLIRVDDAYQSFTKLLETYNQEKTNKKGIEKQTFISESATIGNDIYVGAFAYISDNAIIGNNVKIYPQTFIGDKVKIGDNTILFSGVKIYHECVIGKDCIIHAGAVIGSDGFGFAPNDNNSYDKIPQIGNVIIEDDVEIGPNNCIDRATMGSTIIKKGVKTDNLVHIAHNVVVGENTVLAGQTGISGSSKIGKNCMTGGQVGITGHITVGDNVKIAGQSGVSKNIKNDQVLQGSPAFTYKDYMKSYAYFKNLPSIIARINKLEKNNN